MKEPLDGEVLGPEDAGAGAEASPFGLLGQGLADRLADTLPALPWVLFKWAVRVSIAMGAAWAFGLWWGHVPTWIWVVIGIYAVLSLSLSLALRALHRRAVETLKTRMEGLK